MSLSEKRPQHSLRLAKHGYDNISQIPYITIYSDGCRGVLALVSSLDPSRLQTCLVQTLAVSCQLSSKKEAGSSTFAWPM